MEEQLHSPPYRDTFRGFEAQQDVARNSTRHPPQPMVPPVVRVMPIPVTMLGLGGNIRVVNQLQIAINSNNRRVYWCLYNPLTSGGTLKFSYKNSPTNLIEVTNGALVESSDYVSIDDIWVTGDMLKMPFVAYEGQPAANVLSGAQS